MSVRQSSFLASVGLFALVGLIASTAVRAQNPSQPPSPPPPMKMPIPLKVDVVIARFQGDKKISSAPFTLWVGAVDPRSNTGFVSIRMGIDVPVGSRSETVPNRSGGATTTTTQTPEYRNVGTSIDCRATQLEDGRFSVEVQVHDSSIFTAGGDERAALKVTDPMAFKSFTMNNKLSVRSGQTVEYSTATDRISGEVVKVEVTASVVK